MSPSRMSMRRLHGLPTSEGAESLMRTTTQLDIPGESWRIPRETSSALSTANISQDPPGSGAGELRSPHPQVRVPNTLSTDRGVGAVARIDDRVVGKRQQLAMKAEEHLLRTRAG